MLIYWPHPSALVATESMMVARRAHGQEWDAPFADLGALEALGKNGRTICCLGGTNAGHGPVKILFLSLILFLVPITPCDTMLYWPGPN